MQINNIVFRVLDNSSIVKVKLIKNFSRRFSLSFVGDVFLGVVLQVSNRRNIKFPFKKGSLVYGIVVQTSKIFSNNKHKTGITLRFIGLNSAVLINKYNHNQKKKQFSFYGTRFHGVFSRVLVQKKYLKIYSLSEKIVNLL